MISRRHVAQDPILIPSRPWRDAPTRTGARMSDPDHCALGIRVLTWQDPAGDHAHDQSHPASAEGAKAWQMVRPWGTILTQVLKTPSRWVLVRTLFPWPPLMAGVISQWARTMPW